MALGMTACGGGTIAYLWVLGTQTDQTQPGQIVGFKVDDYTGNLTQVIGSPFSSNGINPVSIVIKPGGRFVYVINSGIPAAGGCPGTPGTGTPGNISIYTVGVGGGLTFQTSVFSQGCNPVWAMMDFSGNYLYVLDSLYPATDAYKNDNGYGDITVFAVDPNSGRLTLVPNQQIKDENQTQLPFFPVGAKPVRMALAGGCIFTVSGADQTIFPYGVGVGGQLNLQTTSPIVTGAGNITSINSTGGPVYITDAAPTADSPGGRILYYTTGTNCTLNTVTGGPVNNLPLTANPSYAMVDNNSRWLYILNGFTTDSQNPNTSSISLFTINTNGQLQAGAGAGTGSNPNNPYAVGAGPYCAVEDPSRQYMFVSNNFDGTVTGRRINNGTGELTGLQHNSTFQATGHATCLAISSAVN